MTGRSITKKVLGITMFASGMYALSLSAEKKKRNGTILFYHRIAEGTDMLDRNTVNATPKNFEKQLAYLKKHCEVLSLQDYIERENLPERAVVITFDDGHVDTYTKAFPLLKKYELPATVFLTTGFMESDELFWWDKVAAIVNQAKTKFLNIPDLGYVSLKNKPDAIRKIQEHLKTIPDKKKHETIHALAKKLSIDFPKGQFLNWEQIREMQKYDITFEPHTVSHPILTQLSEKDAMEEILKSKRVVEEKLSTSCHYFAYPNGGKADVSDTLNTKLESHFDRVFGTTAGNRKRQEFFIRRKGISLDDDMTYFKLKLVDRA